MDSPDSSTPPEPPTLAKWGAAKHPFYRLTRKPGIEKKIDPVEYVLIFEGELIYIDQINLKIGRQSSNDIIIRDKHNLISRRHAIISYENGEYLIKDVGSVNGTYVNNNPTVRKKARRLSSGDVISFSARVKAEFLKVSEARFAESHRVGPAKDKPYRLTINKADGPPIDPVQYALLFGAERVYIDRVEFKIGRSFDNNIVIQDAEEKISAYLSRLYLDDDVYYIENVGISDSITVNGVPLPKGRPFALEQKAVISFGAGIEASFLYVKDLPF